MIIYIIINIIIIIINITVIIIIINISVIIIISNITVIIIIIINITLNYFLLIFRGLQSAESNIFSEN